MRKGGPTIDVTGEGKMGIGREIGGPRDGQGLQKLRQFITVLCAGLHLIGPTASIPALGSRPSCARASPFSPPHSQDPPPFYSIRSSRPSLSQTSSKRIHLLLP